MRRLIPIEALPLFDGFDGAHEVRQVGKGMRIRVWFERHISPHNLKLAASNALDNRWAVPREPIRLGQGPLVEI
jgi:hypothetical protein